MSPEDSIIYEDCEQLAHRKPAKRQPTHKGHNMFETPLMHKVFAAIAAATVIGGGSAILTNREHVAVLAYADVAMEQRLQRIESKVDILILRPSNVAVAR